ncbi:hypothetical protein JTE90_013824 [Oedothorax gibbosus]|uniref:Uncharacterized protein n=1 Tax=Oedothorax gibbosus TaxID=931172 RepID=A0AAV6VI89_9ARAC|nr:hypothetical protein JTE90_013824 [Oedothorax gibbosus]
MLFRGRRSEHLCSRGGEVKSPLATQGEALCGMRRIEDGERGKAEERMSEGDRPQMNSGLSLCMMTLGAAEPSRLGPSLEVEEVGKVEQHRGSRLGNVDRQSGPLALASCVGFVDVYNFVLQEILAVHTERVGWAMSTGSLGLCLQRVVLELSTPITLYCSRSWQCKLKG